MFGRRLNEVLSLQHMSQKDLAKAIGTTETSVSRYISGERIPKITTAAKIADILNVSLDWLCETKGEKKSDGIRLYQCGWNDAIDAMQNAKFILPEGRNCE